MVSTFDGAVLPSFTPKAITFTETTENLGTVTVGASPAPHAQILEHVKDEVAKYGYTLNVVSFDDYVLPNTSLEDGDLTANYFQHEPYLTDFNATRGTHIVVSSKIHYEPMGLFGNGVSADAYKALPRVK
ncbi:MAG TPA: hypothetical protein DDW54_03675 [Clostridiales bacterium]|nr:hypothetical protein [Clostridiales bacterium]